MREVRRISNGVVGDLVEIKKEPGKEDPEIVDVDDVVEEEEEGEAAITPPSPLPPPKRPPYYYQTRGGVAKMAP